MSLKGLFLFVVGIFVFGMISAAEDIDNRVREIAHMLRCPTCQALSVKESDAGLSVNMKERIRELLQEGKSEEEILEFFVERYGEWILRSPKKEGFSLLLWTLPGLILLVTVLLLFQYLRKKSLITSVVETRALSEKEQRQIDNDLKRL
ncbi:MAG: cytochrome c-type biogenesis protein CcmH [Deltaproteobacteria bacterium]|nr:cytochrome c-type biogenesis protein CcmH [Deltaproteobacteria bacterium]MBT4091920.1 cytochrome c-type biogenesis protein CcmH [Deltaproteobacteria bacterium]MBT4263588.1 cytochrome c-type biogenesis protein CcmH [Deltaproteobacteria bacterium]MBT4644333.1 cytochrome c-type biogenesis protein CcmH [Deltaproteobacteria bacterium]MBT6500414.1 cytochrome c-type biogenesis protein CcmH [Deltaproteobacteria bacterium]